MSEIENFLIKYEERFSDYASYHTSMIDGKMNMDDISYHDICFTTAETLYDLLVLKIIMQSDEGAGDVKDTEEIVNNLDGKIVVYLEYMMSSGESHGLCFITIPETEQVVIVQSVGSIYKAYHQYFNKETFKNIIENFMNNDDPITHLGNSHPTEIIKLKISFRKDLNIDLLPKFTPEEEKFIRFERYYWLLQFFDGNTITSSDYQTKMVPNIKEYFIKLHNLDVNSPKLIEDVKKYKLDTIWKEYRLLKELKKFDV